MKIAYLEDDGAIAQDVCLWLRESGHEVHWYQNGLDCVRAVEAEQFDVCVFDRRVPGLCGTDVLMRLQIKLRSSMPPVIFTTGLDSEQDIVTVLQAGADDYITKPLSKSVFLARLDAVCRRSHVVSSDSFMPKSFRALSLNLVGRQFYRDGLRITLTERETDLAVCFFQNIGRLLSRDSLMQIVWGQPLGVETRTMDVHVSNLRRKLQLSPEFGWRLTSIYGYGYRLEQVR